MLLYVLIQDKNFLCGGDSIIHIVNRITPVASGIFHGASAKKINEES